MSERRCGGLPCRATMDRLTAADSTIFSTINMSATDAAECVSAYQKADKSDAEVMIARAKAKARGATPLQVQRHVEALSTFEFPITFRKGFSPVVYAIGRHGEYALEGQS